MESVATPASAPDDVSTHHAFALAVSGYTIMREQVMGAELDALRTSVDLALAATKVYWDAGGRLKYTAISEQYKGARCLYCWGDACVHLLEHDLIHAVAGRMMGKYRLWEMTALTVMPEAVFEPAWHRDFHGLERGGDAPGHLWFFLCLDDTTSQNGATWVVPGSHRLSSEHQPATNEARAYPSRLQVCAQAGDIIVIDPTLLHSPGANHTAKPRRILNIAVAQAALPPLLNHWAIAGPRIQANAGERLRSFLGADRQPLDTTWPVLPEGWQTAADA